MSYLLDQIIKATRLLYPRGRAFKMPANGYLEGLHNGLSFYEKQLIDDAIGTFDHIFPDNADFSEEDATDWEIRYGLIVNEVLDLETRKAAIIRKLNYPGVQSGRQSSGFLQLQLNIAGFEVTVYENIPTQTPESWIGTSLLNSFQFGQIQFGVNQFGGKYPNIVVNSIDAEKDSFFEVGENYKFSSFIGGASAGTYATVPVAREIEFRQLILKIKPANQVIFLFVNYI